MEKGGWAPQAARRELGNFLLSSALLLGTARAQGRRLPVLPSAICLFPSGVCPERRVGLRARRGWVERVLVQRGCAGGIKPTLYRQGTRFRHSPTFDQYWTHPNRPCTPVWQVLVQILVFACES